MYTLKNRTILEDWSQLLAGCKGSGPSFIAAIEHALSAAKFPDLSCERDTMAHSGLGGLMGNRQECLLISGKTTAFPDCLISSRDYGPHLMVLALVLTVTDPTPKDVWERCAVGAYYSVVKAALARACDMCLNANPDSKHYPFSPDLLGSSAT